MDCPDKKGKKNKWRNYANCNSMCSIQIWKSFSKFSSWISFRKINSSSVKFIIYNPFLLFTYYILCYFSTKYSIITIYLYQSQKKVFSWYQRTWNSLRFRNSYFLNNFVSLQLNLYFLGSENKRLYWFLQEGRKRLFW